MKWLIHHTDILTEPADVLICSANVFLNLSGGVGGEILLRYGDAMQRELHQYLSERGLRHVERGDVIKTSPGGTHFKAVVHAVAVDGFYQSSVQVIEETVRRSLSIAGAVGARTVALTALATGFGRLSMKDFGLGVCALMHDEFPPMQQVAICVRKKSEAQELRASLTSEVLAE